MFPPFNSLVYTVTFSLQTRKQGLWEVGLCPGPTALQSLCSLSYSTLQALGLEWKAAAVCKQGTFRVQCPPQNNISFEMLRA